MLPKSHQVIVRTTLNYHQSIRKTNHNYLLNLEYY